jgi:hypothetical protein
MKSLLMIAGMGLTIFLGSFSASAQYCYVHQGGKNGNCVPDGPIGRDSTCGYRCKVAIKDGKPVVQIYKQHRWQVQ